jgi:hypothetical protein
MDLRRFSGSISYRPCPTPELEKEVSAEISSLSEWCGLPSKLTSVCRGGVEERPLSERPTLAATLDSTPPLLRRPSRETREEIARSREVEIARRRNEHSPSAGGPAALPALAGLSHPVLPRSSFCIAPLNGLLLSALCKFNFVGSMDGDEAEEVSFILEAEEVPFILLEPSDRKGVAVGNTSEPAAGDDSFLSGSPPRESKVV